MAIGIGSSINEDLSTESYYQNKIESFRGLTGDLLNICVKYKIPKDELNKLSMKYPSTEIYINL